MDNALQEKIRQLREQQTITENVECLAAYQTPPEHGTYPGLLPCETKSARVS